MTWGPLQILVKAMLKKIEWECNKNGFSLKELPKKLQRNHSTLPKLVDEYHWITITKEFIPPKYITLKKWHQWSYKEVGASSDN